MKWALDPKNESQYAYQLYYIKGAEAANKGEAKVSDVGIKAKDDKTLVVELENPTPFFTELTAFYTYMPINKKWLKRIKTGTQMLVKTTYLMDHSFFLNGSMAVLSHLKRTMNTGIKTL